MSADVETFVRIRYIREVKYNSELCTRVVPPRLPFRGRLLSYINIDQNV